MDKILISIPSIFNDAQKTIFNLIALALSKGFEKEVAFYFRKNTVCTDVMLKMYTPEMELSEATNALFNPTGTATLVQTEQDLHNTGYILKNVNKNN